VVGQLTRGFESRPVRRLKIRSVLRAHQVTVDHARERVTGTASGTVTPDDTGVYIAERMRQNAYTYSQLIDFRTATIDLAPGHNLLSVAMEKRREAQTESITARAAIVATPGSATYGYARQMALRLGFGKAPVEVYAKLDKTEAWLSAAASQSV
jgi:hypothetical protein